MVFATLVLTLFGISIVISPHSIIPAAKADPTAAKLYQLWNGNAYFERQLYNTTKSYDEAAPISGPPLGTNVIYLYYRDHGPNNRNDGIGISLAISTDGGVSFSPQPQGNPVIPLGAFCDTDSNYAIAPSVVYAPKVDTPGNQYYMVYEGSSNGLCPSLGKVHLATSSDGVTWTKHGVIIEATESNCANVGTPFIGYFNNQFYIFYHENCGSLSDLRNKVMMASGAYPDSQRLTKHGLVMDIGNGDSAWDSRTNSRASVIAEPDNTGQLFYYLAFEGAQSVWCKDGPLGESGNPIGNWGWGLARTKNIDSGPWQKFQYNPIRQTYQGGCQNDIPYIFAFGGVVKVFQAGLGQSNVLLQGTTYQTYFGSPSVTIVHPGGDPYLYVFPARSQCQVYHKLGRLDADGISWSANTNDDHVNDHMCYGPYIDQLTPGHYAVDFNLWIDSLSCTQPFCDVLGLDFVNDTASGQPSFHQQTIQRNRFTYAMNFQAFHDQFTVMPSTKYEWRTYWYDRSYLKQSNVTLRYLLDGSLDTSPPTTSMSSPLTSSSSSFAVSWTGSDPDSGVWYYYTQSNDITTGSGWGNFLNSTTPSSGMFTGVACNTYQFQARAIDNAGNLQGWPGGQTSTTVLCGLTASASPASVAADGVSMSTITVQTQDNAQSRIISLSTNLGILSASSCTTGLGGACTVTITSSSYGTATVTASGALYNSASTTVQFADFSISASPTTVTVNVGSLGTSTMTIASHNGFSGAVSIVASVSPSTGLTCSLAPTTVGGSGPSTLSCSGINGTYTVSVTGTSGGLTHSATVIVRAVDFLVTTRSTIAALPTGMSDGTTAFTSPEATGVCLRMPVSANVGSAITSLRIYEGSFTGTTQANVYAATGNPDVNNLHCTPTSTVGRSNPVNLNVLTSAYQTITFTFPQGQQGAVVAGNVYMVVFWFNGTFTPTNWPSIRLNNATDSSQTAQYYNPGYSQPWLDNLGRCNIQTACIYYVLYSATGASIMPGSSTTAPVTVTSQGFSGTVTLSASVAPSGPVVSVSPTSVSISCCNSIESTLSVSTGGATPGTYTVTVTGTSNAVSHSATFIVTVTDFTISASPTTQTVNTGVKATSAVTLNPINGFSGTVNLSVSTGAASCSISPASVSIPPSPATATLLCSASTPGRYSISVTGSSGSLTHSTSVSMVVGLAFNFQDNFTYASIGQMSTVGWNFVTPSQISVGGGSLTLVNNGIAGSQATWGNVTSGVGNWTVAARAEWVGGAYGTLQLNAFTARHSYVWHGDGYYNQYIFYRDGQPIIRINGYTPAMNVWHTLRIDMLNSKISLYFDSNLITTYTETDPGTSLTQFGVASGWESTDSYTFMQANLLKFTLTLQGYDYNQAQEETLTLNGQVLAQLPTTYTKANTKTYATFSLDMTSLFVRGTNTLTFTHANTDCKIVDSTRNVQITDANGAIIFSDPTVRPLSCTQSITYTFTI